MFRATYANREMIMSGFVVSACFLLSYFFPVQGTYQNVISFVTFMVLIPAIYAKFILKKDLAGFGLQIGDWKKGLFFGGAGLAVSLLIVYILLNYTSFQETQGFLERFQNNFGDFVAYELLFVGTLVAVFEFFFRGFVLNSLPQKFGPWSVVIQFFVFLAYAFITNGLNLGLAYFSIVAFFSGIIVYYSRSILYSVIYGWLFILISDAIVIRLIG